jgi:hypothetical protein
VVKDKECVRVPSPLERNKGGKFLERRRFESMADALQAACILWEQGAQRALQELLQTTYGGKEAFWQVAQAVAEVLPEDDKERQLLMGLLYSRRTQQQGRLL